MKRLVVFVVYDYKGIIDDYVKKILTTLIEEYVANKLVIVINGFIEMKSYEQLLLYTPYIYQRENKGFDAGAYKDTILMYLKDEKWEEWDELILMNDTFYGPIFPWKAVLDKMDNLEIDFWGLSRHNGGIGFGGISFKEHIQGYFIACRKNIILSDAFGEFWEELNYPKILLEAVLEFEIYFTEFFSQKGYKYIAYTDLYPEVTRGEGINLYIDRMYELISEIEFPIIKRKALSVINFTQAKKAFEYLDKNTKYDSKLIIKHIERLDKEKKIVPFGYGELETFYNAHKNIYIYGKGKYGKEIEKYFIYKNWKLAKFIVTNNDEREGDIVSINELELDSEDGVIIGLSKVYSNQVYPMLKEKLKESQILRPRW